MASSVHHGIEIQLRTDFAVGRLHLSQHDVLLGGGRPGTAGGVSRLKALSVKQRMHSSPGLHRETRRQAGLGKSLTVSDIIQHQAYETVRTGALFLLFKQGVSAHEIALLEVHGPAQTQFIRGRSLRDRLGPKGGKVVYVEHNKTRFHSGHIEGPDSGRHKSVGKADVDQAVPKLFCLIRRYPDLVPEVARIAGSGNPERHGVHLEGSRLAKSEVVHSGPHQLLQQRSAGGALEGQDAEIVGDVFDAHLETGRHFQKPGLSLLGSGQLKMLFTETG